MMHRALVLACVAFLNNSLLAQPRSLPVASKEPNKPIEVRDDNAYYYVNPSPSGVAELGKMFQAYDPLTQLEGRLELINQSGGPITIRRTRTTCGCIAAETRNATIEEGKSFILTYRVAIGKGIPQINQSVVIDCDGALDQIRINFLIPVNNVVSFVDPLHYQTIDPKKEEVEFKLKCYLTGDITPKDVRVTATGELAYGKFEIVKTAAESFVKGSIRKDDIPPDGLVESIELHCLKTGETSRARIEIYNPDMIRVAPKTVSLRKSIDSKTVESGNVIISITDANEGILYPSDITASLNGIKKMDVDVIQLSDRVLRVKCKASESDIADIDLAESSFITLAVKGKEHVVSLLVE